MPAPLPSQIALPPAGVISCHRRLAPGVRPVMFPPMARLLPTLVPLALLSLAAFAAVPCRAGSSAIASATAEALAKAGALPAPDPDDGAINLPPGFRALVVADNLLAGRPRDALRFLTVAPNGDI